MERWEETVGSFGEASKQFNSLRRWCFYFFLKGFQEDQWKRWGKSVPAGFSSLLNSLSSLVFLIASCGLSKFTSCLWQLTLYLGKRDYVDHVERVEKIGTFLYFIIYFIYVCKPDLLATHLKLHSPSHFTDGVVKLDTKDFGDRKGNAAKSALRVESCTDVSGELTSRLWCLDSVRAAGVCLPLRERWPGRDGPVLPEGHLDQACADLPREPQAGQERHAWHPAEEGWRQLVSLHLRGTSGCTLASI